MLIGVKVKDLNIEYLEKNFLSFEEIAKEAKCSTSRIEHLIQSNILPRASYVLKETIEIQGGL